MTVADAVLDSSVLVRAAFESGEAEGWLEAVHSRRVRASAPELIYAEAANALVRTARAGSISAGDAAALLDSLLLVPLEIHPLASLAPAALAVALERELTAYDAFYVVVAEAADAQLVTADRRLAAATDRSVLIE